MADITNSKRSAEQWGLVTLVGACLFGDARGLFVWWPWGLVCLAVFVLFKICAPYGPMQSMVPKGPIWADLAIGPKRAQ
jgi:hypothetical protein